MRVFGIPLWLPPSFSTHGPSIDRLIVLIHLFMALLFVGWGIYLAYCLVRFRAREGHAADPKVSPFRFPIYLEATVVLVEVALLVFLSSPIWADYRGALPNEKDAIIIHLVAEQFAWNFHYPGRDGKFGPTKPALIDGTNPLGLDRTVPEARDDIVAVNELHVPVNRPVIIQIQSKDVIHSFNIPALRVKQDAIPGMSIPVWFQATQTGIFDIACAQLCGVGHYRMRGQLIVNTATDYEVWLAEQAKELGGL
jgi:cytochrome c oxidase subunit 2